MTQTIKTETLYRKYRPEKFDQVIGQDEVIGTLKKQIESGSIAHAYLFSGGRGTGKTSIARIFAHELGCDTQDVYEIDAASNRGINEIREVRDGVANRPFASAYKVYIIDEVHMLTKEAFNALLKTLEEPPAHVIFILATTEKHKVLDTILSRCQVYDFKLGNITNLVSLVESVTAAEERKIDAESALYVAQKGNGSFRDTLSYLQKVLGAIEGDVVRSNIEEVFNISNSELEINMLTALSEKNQTDLFTAYHSILEQKIEINQVVDNLLEYTRKVLLLRYESQYKNIAKEEITEDIMSVLESASGVTSHTLKELLLLTQLIKKTSRPEESLEVFLYEQCEKWNK